MRLLDRPYTAPVAPVAVDTTIAAVDIVAADGGYAVVLERLAKTAVDTGRAIAIVGDAVPIEQGHYLIGGQKCKPNETARQLFEIWVKQTFE